MDNIAFYCTRDHVKYKQALEISQFLSAKLLSDPSDITKTTIQSYDCIVTWYYNKSNNEYYLSLLDEHHKYLYIDYVNQVIGNKKCYSFHKNDNLPKALGLAKLQNKPIELLDGTAGFTLDAFGLMSSDLCDNVRFTLVEQSRVIYYLIKDALERLSKSEQSSHQQLCRNVTVVNANLVDYLEQLQAIEPKKFDLIYLDPMFCKKDKVTAKPKKNMQILQEIGQNLCATEDLIIQACKQALYKVILKRAKSQPKIFSDKINYSVESKQIRYDVYLTGKAEN